MSESRQLEPEFTEIRTDTLNYYRTEAAKVAGLEARLAERDELRALLSAVLAASPLVYGNAAEDAIAWLAAHPLTPDTTADVPER